MDILEKYDQIIDNISNNNNNNMIFLKIDNNINSINDTFINDIKNHFRQKFLEKNYIIDIIIMKENDKYSSLFHKQVQDLYNKKIAKLYIFNIKISDENKLKIYGYKNSIEIDDLFNIFNDMNLNNSIFMSYKKSNIPESWKSFERIFPIEINIGRKFSLSLISLCIDSIIIWIKKLENKSLSQYGSLESVKSMSTSSNSSIEDE
uniref:Uncharacterized protein n=1 Tax=Pithovirus LCPAC104 TaxID=2506589 RepID=A0A481Z468_9VIRU|nr:MAG: hypothetical protein LCPAC104_00530 [Pithovirus LCPAC104]